MTFKEAKEKLKELAAGRYHSLKFELTEHAADNGGGSRPDCSCYIQGVGWTSNFNTYEKALINMEEMILQKDNPQLIEEMMPDVIEVKEAA